MMHQKFDLLNDAYETLGLQASASEDDVRFAAIESIQSACVDPEVNDLNSRICDVLCAEDTIKCFELDAKHPGALDRMGYSPETQRTSFEKTSANIACALQTQGPEILSPITTEIERYRRLEQSEILAPSKVEKIAHAVGAKLPAELGQILSRAASPSKRADVTASLLERERISTTIEERFSRIKTQGEAIRADSSFEQDGLR